MGPPVLQLGENPIDKLGALCHHYLQTEGETAHTLTVVAAVYTTLVLRLMAAAESTRGCQIVIDHHPVGFWRVVIKGQKEFNHQYRINLALEGKLKPEFVHDHAAHSSSFNMSGGYDNRFFMAKLQGAVVGGPFFSPVGASAAKRYLRWLSRGFIQTEDGEMTQQKEDIGIAELNPMFEFPYCSPLRPDGGYHYYFMHKKRLHRLDNYAADTVSSHTRGLTDVERTTIQFPINNRPPQDGNTVPSDEEKAQVMERLRQVSPMSAHIYEIFGGDYGAIYNMPLEAAGERIIQVVDSYFTKKPMEWLTPDGAIQAGRFATIPTRF
ncbi:unnamed protein product [Vitrella brassicaformis CCMP3155]|uniref:Uncharacterized protein n=2 Tax=Vitrella brassicaformis TaxID=1169539 RepID=A0A0G4EF22_VITBC|nr:unnamed protein product [Vitrella brassicaformis CCMP3155]|eukprot:CEL94001.1 unnamed protein product [Vitrella brassicaformis CCMP3155]